MESNTFQCAHHLSTSSIDVWIRKAGPSQEASEGFANSSEGKCTSTTDSVLAVYDLTAAGGSCDEVNSLPEITRTFNGERWRIFDDGERARERARERDDMFKLLISDLLPVDSGVLCDVCYLFTITKKRPCCNLSVCDSCMQQYCETQVSEGKVRISCLSPNCQKVILREDISTSLKPETKIKFHRFLVGANSEPHLKTCPRCSKVTNIDKQLLNHVTRKNGLRVTCTDCAIIWCFPCQAPWHEGISCSKYKKGDKLVKKWSKQSSFGQKNAQKCPRCKIFIQRSTGCDYMTCSQCNKSFCYQCGGRFINIKFLGGHHSRFSIFGCKHEYLPDKPLKRRLVRGSIFGGKLLAALVIAGVAVPVGAVAVGLGAVFLPFYVGYKLYRRAKPKKKKVPTATLR